MKEISQLSTGTVCRRGGGGWVLHRCWQEFNIKRWDWKQWSIRVASEGSRLMVSRETTSMSEPVKAGFFWVTRHSSSVQLERMPEEWKRDWKPGIVLLDFVLTTCMSYPFGNFIDLLHNKSSKKVFLVKFGSLYIKFWNLHRTLNQTFYSIHGSRLLISLAMIVYKC